MSDVPLQHGWVPVIENRKGLSENHVNVAHIVEAWVEEVYYRAEDLAAFEPRIRLSNGQVRIVANDRYGEWRYSSREKAQAVLEAWVFLGSVDVTQEHRRHLGIQSGM